MGCGCNKPRRPNVNDAPNLRAVTADPQRYVWKVGDKTFDLLHDAKAYSDKNEIPITRKLI